MPQRIQRRMTAEWRAPLDEQGQRPIYVGRPGQFGNPFRIYKGHSAIGPMWHVAVDTWGHIPADECVCAYASSSEPLGPESVVELYRMMLEARRQDDPDRLREWLAPLAGRDLMCWCPLGSPCHADVLLELANPGGARG
ncbi:MULTISPECIES: DUF4326 domain-containing protein [Glycomyces]|uniref:DUF4326 domain-containing protein n=2 Tax=Glycomyces TaxID=58113 RepID=A0ABU2AI87_9ACTN|nr:DUF4326 domain-containing protein [Glycomyces lechevalierae]MDR7336790.1 hypothetical protein [Glycomyces lechevalierae]